MLSFTVFGEAKPAGSKRGFIRNGRVIITDANANSKPWKQEVAAAAAEAMRESGLALLDEALVVSFEFYMPRPKGHFGKKGLLPSARPFPSTKPDLLKAARGIEDSMTGVVFRDDALIVSEHLHKRYGEPARVEVWVGVATPLEPIGMLRPITTGGQS